jgi:chromosome segregation protein
LAEASQRGKLEAEAERRRLERAVVAAKQELEEERRRRRDEEGRMRRELLAMTEVEEEERLREAVEEVRVRMKEDAAKWETERKALLTRLDQGGTYSPAETAEEAATAAVGGSCARLGAGGRLEPEAGAKSGSKLQEEVERLQGELRRLMSAANERQLKQAHERAALVAQLEKAESALDAIAEEMDEVQAKVEEAEAAVEEARRQWEEDKCDLAQQVELMI